MLFFPQSETDRFVALAAPIFWPIGYLIIFLPMGIILSIFRVLPFVHFISAFFSLIAVAIGDPIVCLIHKFFSKLVPVESPPLFSFCLVFWVLDAPEFSIAE